ncbi:MAG: hypothetical protein WBC20_00575, partial [Candidatus Aminicenantaceae bacterium]
QIKNEINQVKNETLSLLAEFNARGQERTKEVKDLQAATQAMLEDFHGGDKERAKEVKDLQAATQAYIAECAEAGKTRAKEVDGLKKEVANLIGGYKAEHEEAAAAWNDLLTNMSNIRKGAAPERKEAIPEKPKEKPEKNKKTPAKAIKVKQEEAKAVMKEAKKKKLELSEKERKILSIVNANPEGISLPEIANVMEVAYITITRDIKKLLTDGLIKKEDYLYFPA